MSKVSKNLMQKTRLEKSLVEETMKSLTEEAVSGIDPCWGRPGAESELRAGTEKIPYPSRTLQMQF